MNWGIGDLFWGGRVGGDDDDGLGDDSGKDRGTKGGRGGGDKGGKGRYMSLPRRTEKPYFFTLTHI